MRGPQPDLGAVLVTWGDIHTDMRPRTLPMLPAVSGETKGPGSPDVGRIPFAAPATIPSFTAWLAAKVRGNASQSLPSESQDPLEKF